MIIHIDTNSFIEDLQIIKKDLKESIEVIDPHEDPFTAEVLNREYELIQGLINCLKEEDLKGLIEIWEMMSTSLAKTFPVGLIYLMNLSAHVKLEAREINKK